MDHDKFLEECEKLAKRYKLKYDMFPHGIMIHQSEQEWFIEYNPNDKHPFYLQHMSGKTKMKHHLQRKFDKLIWAFGTIYKHDKNKLKYSR